MLLASRPKPPAWKNWPSDEDVMSGASEAVVGAAPITTTAGLGQ
jgi:hypothetical protein